LIFDSEVERLNTKKVAEQSIRGAMLLDGADPQVIEAEIRAMRRYERKNRSPWETEAIDTSDPVRRVA
jgi:hypothetical protein